MDNFDDSEYVRNELLSLGVSKYDIETWFNNFSPAYVMEKVIVAKKKKPRNFTAYLNTLLYEEPKESTEKRPAQKIPEWVKHQDRVRALIKKQGNGNTSTGNLTRAEWEELNTYIPLTDELKKYGEYEDENI